MKICLINNLYPPYHRGGAEIVVENQAKEFLTQGHDVFVITSKPVEHIAGTQNLAFLQSKIYRFHPLNIISYYHLNKLSFVFRVLWRLLDIFNWQAYFKIKKIFKQEKPDIVYGHNLTGLGLLIPRLIKKLRIKYIQTMHDVVGVRPSGLLIFGKEKEIFLIKLWSSLNRWLYDSPDEVHFPSAWLKNFYAARGFFKNSGKKVLRNFALPPDENLLANKKPKLQGEINFLYLGQIEEHKGVEFLLKYDDGAQMRTIRPVTPYPGSPLYYYAIEKGLIKDCEDFYENKHLNSDLMAVNFTKLNDEELQKLRQSAKVISETIKSIKI